MLILQLTMLTWFIKTSIPALRPFATESSRTFSNRFFSRTTLFKKSVTSMLGACQDNRETIKVKPGRYMSHTSSLSK